MEVHAHGEDCFALERGALLCALPETAEHIHGDTCYTTEPVLTCTLTESEGHRHDLVCYDNQGMLICGLEESDGHSHGEECRESRQRLVCTLTQDVIHEHTDDCYEMVERLICPLETPESMPEPMLVCSEPEILLHTHGEECFDEDGLLLCPKTEIMEHVHSETCFVTVDVPLDTAELTCALPEEDEGHRHSELCYGIWELSCTQSEHSHDELCTPPSPTAEPTPEPTPEPGCPSLTADEAYVVELRSLGGRVLSESGDERMPMTVMPGERVEFPFAVTTGSYTGQSYGQGRIKLEFVLPVGEEKAVFDLTALSWADTAEGYAPSLTWETRPMGEEAVNCQVLTAWWPLGDESGVNPVIPGTVEGAVTVEVRDMAPDETLGLHISAAMEHNAWAELCQTHQTWETLSVATDAFTLISLRNEEEMQAQRDALEAEVAALEALSIQTVDSRKGAQALQEQATELYQNGTLTAEEYLNFSERLERLLAAEMEPVSELGNGNNWKLLLASGWFEPRDGGAPVAVSAPPPVELAPPMFRSFAINRAIPPSDVQIKNYGGTNTSADGAVAVSKTIAGTDLENVFDITLKVQTAINVLEISQEPDMAVVIVMDISNTMTYDFGGQSRYYAAMEAAENFLKEFAAHNSMGISKVGFVSFNTSAHKTLPLQPCTSEAHVTTLVNTIKAHTRAIIGASNYASSYERFTNVEAGLAMGADMLSEVDNEHKFIIFLSDGFPTTYINPNAGEDYVGYNPYDKTGVRFRDDVLGVPCSSGTSYSDKAAIRAREKATAIKNSGITIFSIGVDVGGQTVQAYVDDSVGYGTFSVVDRTSETYEIGSATDKTAYQNWLRNSIGSGYYYDSTNTAGLNQAYEQIFTEIKHKVEQGAEADWVTADPLPTASGVAGSVEFIGLYTKEPKLAGDTLTGSYTPNGENTASYDAEKSIIYWDLKKSGYEFTSTARSNIYVYELVYRVRLKNEDGRFIENDIYPTNDPTTLQYRTVLTRDGVLSRSGPLTVNYQIPSVLGYLAELSFEKQNAYGGPLAGAVFTLAHDEESCRICRGNDKMVDIVNREATSAADGSVTFTGIPSGHRYTLTETQVPEGFSPTGDKYAVEVAYDKLTVTVTAYDGAAKDWTGVVVNQTYYELPATGGRGTAPYILGGLALMALSGVLLLRRRRRTTS